MSNEVVIRQATIDDWNSLAALIAQMNFDHSQKFDPINSIHLVGEGILHGIRTNEAVYVAELDNKMVGYCAWVHLPLSPEGLVNGYGTYVDEAHRGKKISEKLRASATKHCKLLGYDTIQGVAHLDNDAGLQSSLRNGFEIKGHLLQKAI